MKTRTILTICAALAIGGFIGMETMNALGKAEEKTPVGEKAPMVEKAPINDSWLTSRATIALFADARIKGSEINVETTQGAMVIRGKVDSKDAKLAAEGIAKGIEGVTSVKNDLQVVTPAKRAATDDKDAAVTTRVTAQIEKDADLKKAGIRARTNAGVVSLSGEVHDLKTSARASWIAWQVPGVKSVQNDLTVKEKA